MAKLWCLRIAGASGLVSLTLVLVSLNPFLSATPGAGIADKTPAVSVNRTLKGDRLPLFHSGISGSTAPEPGVLPELRAPDGSRSRNQIPVGCDPAFSPVSAPSPANVYGRCMV